MKNIKNILTCLQFVQDFQKNQVIMEHLKKYELRPDPNEILVQVTNPTQIKGTLSNHTVYTIQGFDLTGSFNVLRRYSDFDHVRMAILNKWPGCYVPSIPKKKAIGNNQFLFVQSRRVGLSYFCKQMAHLKHLWYSQQFQAFMRGPQDLQKSLKNMQEESTEELATKYKQTLFNLSGKDYQEDLVKKVDDFQKYLKKTLTTIANYKQTAKSILECSTSNSEQYGILLNYFFPEFQKHFLSVYVGSLASEKFIFSNSSDQKLISLVDSFKKTMDLNKLQELYLMLQKQERQIEAFLQVYKVKSTFQAFLKSYQNKQKQLVLDQSKLNAGKQSMFKVILKSNIEEQKKNVQIAIDLNSIKIKDLTFVCDLIIIIMANFEIPRFKCSKVKIYFQTIKVMTEYQIKLATAKQDFCDYILQNSNLSQIESIDSSC